MRLFFIADRPQLMNLAYKSPVVTFKLKVCKCHSFNHYHQIMHLSDQVGNPWVDASFLLLHLVLLEITNNLTVAM